MIHILYLLNDTEQTRYLDQGLSICFRHKASKLLAIEQRQVHILIEKCPLFHLMYDSEIMRKKDFPWSIYLALKV